MCVSIFTIYDRSLVSNIRSFLISRAMEAPTRLRNSENILLKKMISGQWCTKRKISCINHIVMLSRVLTCYLVPIDF
jgi:hypothetical protein